MSSKRKPQSEKVSLILWVNFYFLPNCKNTSLWNWKTDRAIIAIMEIILKRERWFHVLLTLVGASCWCGSTASKWWCSWENKEEASAALGSTSWSNICNFYTHHMAADTSCTWCNQVAPLTFWFHSKSAHYSASCQRSPYAFQACPKFPCCCPSPTANWSDSLNTCSSPMHETIRQ